MENKPNSEISELLANLRKNVEKGSEDSSLTSSSEATESTGELLQRLRQHIGASESTPKEAENNSQEYNLDGYEFTTEESEISESESEGCDENMIDDTVCENHDSLLARNESDEIEEANAPLSGKDDESVSTETETYTKEQQEAIQKKVEEYVKQTLDSGETVDLLSGLYHEEIPTPSTFVENLSSESEEEEALDISDDKERYVKFESHTSEFDEDDEVEETFEAVEMSPESRRFFYAKSMGGSGDDKEFREIDEFDDTDINLAISLGARASLEESIGYSRVRSAGNGFYDPGAETLTGKRALGYEGKEFRSYEQIDSIKKRYYSEKRSLTGRLIGMILLTVLILFFECLPLTSLKIPYITAFLQNPISFYGFSLLLSLCLFLLSFKQIGRGLVALIGLKGDPFSFVAFLACFNILYHICVLLFFRDMRLPVYNLVIAVFLLLGMVDEFMRLSNERLAFEVISSNKPKLSLELLDANLQTEKRDISLNKKDFFVEKINFVGNFFSRMGRRPLRFREYGFEFILCLIVAMLITILSTYVVKSTSYACNTFLFVLLLCLPMQYLTLGIYPFFRLSKGLSTTDSAVIGEAVTDEYNDADTVYLDDVEMFGKHGVQVAGIRVYHDMDFYEVLSYALSTFSILGAPLCHVFDNSAKEIQKREDVKITGISDGGIEALFGSGQTVLFGNIVFMRSHGIFPKVNPDDEKKTAAGQAAILYMAIDNELYAKMYMQYHVTQRFEKFATEMLKNGVKVGIRTLDPNVNEKMIAELRGDKEASIKVIRPTPNELIPIGKHSDSGIVTSKNSHMIFKILAQCFNIKQIHGKQRIFRILYMLIGFAVSVFIMSCKGYEYIPSLLIVIYQLIWMLPPLIYTKSNLK